MNFNEERRQHFLNEAPYIATTKFFDENSGPRSLEEKNLLPEADTNDRNRGSLPVRTIMVLQEERVRTDGSAVAIQFNFSDNPGRLDLCYRPTRL
jgi:hypothetical protein